MRFNKALFIVLIFFTFGCSETQSSESNNEGNAETGPLQKIEERKDLLTSYIELKDALIQSDVELTKKAAQNILASTGQAAPSFEKAIMVVATKIKDSDILEVQRENFEQLSLLIYALAGNGQFTGIKLYKQFCPMAFNNKGAYWLSIDEEIVNPYFGDRMLHCGTVQEVIE